MPTKNTAAGPPQLPRVPSQPGSRRRTRRYHSWIPWAIRHSTELTIGISAGFALAIANLALTTTFCSSINQGTTTNTRDR